MHDEAAVVEAEAGACAAHVAVDVAPGPGRQAGEAVVVRVVRGANAEGGGEVGGAGDGPGDRVGRAERVGDADDRAGGGHSRLAAGAAHAEFAAVAELRAVQAPVAQFARGRRRMAVRNHVRVAGCFEK